MPFLKGENPHRPDPGSVLKVEPGSSRDTCEIVPHSPERLEIS